MEWNVKKGKFSRLKQKWSFIYEIKRNRLEISKKVIKNKKRLISVNFFQKATDYVR